MDYTFWLTIYVIGFIVMAFVWGWENHHAADVDKARTPYEIAIELVIYQAGWPILLPLGILHHLIYKRFYRK